MRLPVKRKPLWLNQRFAVSSLIGGGCGTSFVLTANDPSDIARSGRTHCAREGIRRKADLQRRYRPEAAFRLCELDAKERSFTMAYSRAPWHRGRASGKHQGVRPVVAGSVGKPNDGALALRGDVVRMEGQRLPALGREQRQLVVGPRRREVAALAIGQQSMRDGAALVEGHHLDVAAAEVDVVATRIDGGLALRFQLVEHAFEFISAVQRDLLTANDARFGNAHRHLDREARRAHDADGLAERLE